MRQFIAFLFQDVAGADVAFAELRPEVFQRFQRWRMAPHNYTIGWQGKSYSHASAGGKGESVQRNLDDVRAALNHAADEGRLPYAPKVKGVKRELRAPPLYRVLTIPELGAMVGYACEDKPLFRFMVAMLATAARPEAVRKWRPKQQAALARGLSDIHPPKAPRTRKHNPVGPIPAGWLWFLRERVKDNEPPPPTLRTRWRTMRRVLDLGPEVHAKTIRHTVATWMRASGVPEMDVKGQIGHSIGVTGIYAKYRPDYLRPARTSIDALGLEIAKAAVQWRADHLRTKTGNGPIVVVARDQHRAMRLQA